MFLPEQHVENPISDLPTHQRPSDLDDLEGYLYGVCNAATFIGLRVQWHLFPIGDPSPVAYGAVLVSPVAVRTAHGASRHIEVVARVSWYPAPAEGLCPTFFFVFAI